MLIYVYNDFKVHRVCTSAPNRIRSIFSLNFKSSRITLRRPIIKYFSFDIFYYGRCAK